MFAIPLLLLLILFPFICFANQQAYYGQQWPYYPASAQQQAGGFYQPQFRGPYTTPYYPYNRPYGSSSPSSSPYSSYTPYSPPYSPNSYYGYGTNSAYQQNRLFGQSPFGVYPQGGRQSSLYPFYPTGGTQYDQRQQYGGTASNFYSRFSPYGAHQHH